MIRRLAAVLLLAAPLAAQGVGQAPASLEGRTIRSQDGVMLTLPWRFAPGDDAARAAPSFDDAAWQLVAPLDAPDPGAGWFRRHLRIAPDLVGQPVVLRVAARGAVEVFVDGRPVLSSFAPGGMGEASATTVFGSPSSVIAVRRLCEGCPQGFLLGVEAPGSDAGRQMHSILWAFLATVPVVLALIHFGLWLSDRRARENLFLALSLASFSGIVAFSGAGELAALFPGAAALGRLVTPSILGAEFFSLMTYYVVRRRPLPRTWIAFAGVAAVLAVAVFWIRDSDFRNIIWSLYFVAMVVEVVRLELRSPTRPATGARPLLIGMIVLLLAILLQVLVVAGIVRPAVAWGNPYYFGMIAFAVGASLFTVNSFTATRRKLERNEGEIASARKLQEAMLPRELPVIGGLDLAAFLSTATEVGGDYYDFREAPDGSLLVAVGDAAGHGLAAGAMVTAMKALFSSVRGDEDLPEILDRSDAVLRRMDVRLLHMCLMLARFRAGSVEVCSAAMPPALIHRAATGRVEELGAGGLPLGGRLRGSWESRSTQLAPGDTILLASDGLGELLDPAGDPFGFEAAAAAFARAAGGTAQQVIDRINSEASGWRSGAEQADDLTIVVARVSSRSTA